MHHTAINILRSAIDELRASVEEDDTDEGKHAVTCAREEVEEILNNLMNHRAVKHGYVKYSREQAVALGNAVVAEVDPASIAKISTADLQQRVRARWSGDPEDVLLGVAFCAALKSALDVVKPKSDRT